MEKLVTLKLGDGSLEAGLSVILQIGEDGQRPSVELTGFLPPAPELAHIYQRWQIAYRRLGVPYRLESIASGFATNVSKVEDCFEVAQEFSQQLNHWLSADGFQPLRDKLLEQLAQQDQIRIILQTPQATVQHLPWHAWAICDRYPKAEIALSAPAYEGVGEPSVSRQQVRILAILGHSQGIDVQTDQALLNHLPHADVQFLVEPSRRQLNERLWDPKGWDILFFAGHSLSQTHSQTETTGRLYLNPTDSLSIPELKHALRKSLERGLKIALFNSCDGLGLAQALSDLGIPQVLVMREPVPDRVAHEFLKSFLEAFARGQTFYLAVREAREKLQGLEDRYPCATWLPMICQNPAELPPTWSALSGVPTETTQSVSSRQPSRSKPNWKVLAASSLMTGLAVLGLSQSGGLQGWELRGLDWLMRLRPRELPDHRLLVITLSEADVQAQDAEQRRGSLSDAALSALLQKLEPMEPRVIGLDIYHDFPVSQPQLVQQLQTTDRLLAICKSSDADSDMPGIAPPAELPENRVGFSDFVTDPDGVVRRHLLALSPAPASPCQASYALSTLLAMRYLAEEGIAPVASDRGLQLGAVLLNPLEADFGGYQGIDARGHQVMLNYRRLAAPSQIAEQVSLSDVLAGRVNAEAVRDRIVLIGTTARSFGDYWPTPYRTGSAGQQETAGVFMQAQMVSQLLSAVLDDRPLIQSWPEWAEILWILGWAAVGGVAGVQVAANFSWGRLLLAGLAIELTLFGLCWLLLVRSGYWLPWVSPAIAVVANMGGSVAYAQLRQSPN
ncbi:CHASE2 domain-containing protein [Romeria aff. gracilis LEGE 07310]|uniref:CHASE2 domain-containing protein n=1 Tax=Vasconcelosia minhoensis LEGE 07310 TaxID=915328 RepID=A0A8J7A6F3_9CYAN|nr:CHASE2 domain-containing protein [Romeria gracilis]MBE9077567.1 CHASE2 domain-containing protein [Romeria aff. gracilis LEGE 07310]